MFFTCQNQSCQTRWDPKDVTVKDEGQGTRLVNALTLRVTLTGMTVALLVWGFYSGQLVSHAPW